MTDDHPGGSTTDHDAALERRFRRLLRAYPHWYRRHRGEELLGTLLDTSDDGRHRPTRHQRLDILRGGLATRLRVRGQAGNTVLAVVVALVGAILGMCVGAWLSWLTAPELPDADDSAAIATEVFGGVAPDDVVGDASLFAYDTDYYGGSTDPAWLVALLGGDDYGRGARIAVFDETLSEKEWRAVVPRVEGNLTRTGWDVTSATIEGGSTHAPDALSVDLTAYRDGYVVTVTGYTDPATAELWIERADPPAVPAGMIAGAVAGLLAGWLLGVRIAWQVTVRHPQRRGVVLPVLSIATMIGFPPLLSIVLFVVLTLTGAQSQPGSPPWWPLMAFPYRPLCVLALLSATVAVGYALAPRRRRVPVRYARSNAPVG